MKNILSEEQIRRVLSSPFSNSLLGVEISADIIAKNGFRFLSISAFSSETEFEEAAQTFLNMYKLDPGVSFHSLIKIGYEEFVSLDEVTAIIAKLNDPKFRFINSLFWLQINQQLFDALKKSGELNSNHFLNILLKHSQEQDDTDIRILHAIAITYLNLAILNEIYFANGRKKWNPHYWNMAYQYWSKLLNSNFFWEYWETKVTSLDDPGLKSTDISILRSQLPLVLLEFSSIFAQEYAKNQLTKNCKYKISVIYNSSFEEEIKRKILKSLAQSIVIARLEPLILTIENKVKQHSDKLTRETFDKIFSPILNNVIDFKNYLLYGLGFPVEIIESLEFDHFIDLFFKNLNSKLNYDSGNYSRNILYSSIIIKKLLELPLSSALRHKLRLAFQKDKEYLYGDFLDDSSRNLDFTECYFVEGEQADPDESIEMWVYKIEGVKGTSVSWKTRCVLVPRSKLGAKFHRAQISYEELARQNGNEEVQELIGELKEIKEKGQQKVADINEEKDKAVTKLKNEMNLEIEQYNQTVQSEKQNLQKKLSTIKKKVNREIKKEEDRLNNIFQKLKNEYDPIIEDLNAQYQRIVEANTRFMGLRKIELPLFIIFFLIFSLHYGSKGFLKIEMVFILAGLSALLFSFGIGLIIRTIQNKKAHYAVKKKHRELGKQVEQLKSESNTRIKAIKNSYAPQINPLESQLQEMANQEEMIRNKYETKIESVSQQYQQKIDSLKSQIDKEVAPIFKKLNKIFKPKSESAKETFPPYRRAKGIFSFRDGTEPSQYEVDRLVKKVIDRFFDSLSYEERQYLSILAQNSSNDNFAKIVSYLMDLSASERKAKLKYLSSIIYFRKDFF